MTEQTLAHLAMLRRAARPVVGGNLTKRPVGGRPNPCALHREPRHGLAVAREATRRRAPRQDPRLVAVHQRLADAVADGTIPVGARLTDGELRQCLAVAGLWGGMSGLALQLAEHRSPVRLREVGDRKWIVALA